MRNLRPIDIVDHNKEVWRYLPFTHKTEHKGKSRIVAIGPKAQAILTPYLIEKEEQLEAFLFSPQDAVKLQKVEKRRNRKTLNKKGQVQPSQQDRSKSSRVLVQNDVKV